MARDNIQVNDRQLACAKIHSKEGQDYLAGMSAAANFAWVNRASITMAARKAFSQVFEKDPRDMDMHVVYDVSHNIAKVCFFRILKYYRSAFTSLDTQLHTIGLLGTTYHFRPSKKRFIQTDLRAHP